jgi:hypothetical protein
MSRSAAKLCTRKSLNDRCTSKQKSFQAKSLVVRDRFEFESGPTGMVKN